MDDDVSPATELLQPANHSEPARVIGAAAAAPGVTASDESRVEVSTTQQPAAATPAAVAAAFSSLISVPLAVLQTLPGIDTALLASFLRSEVNEEYETAIEKAAAARRAAEADAAARQRQRWFRWRRRTAPPAVMETAPQVAQAEPLLTTDAAAKEPPQQPSHPRGPSTTAETVVVSTTTGAHPTLAMRRRRSLSDIRAAVLPALAAPGFTPASLGILSAGSPSIAPPTLTSPSAATTTSGRHAHALSSEPVLALTQLQRAGLPPDAARTPTASTTLVYAGLRPATPVEGGRGRDFTE